MINEKKRKPVGKPRRKASPAPRQRRPDPRKAPRRAAAPRKAAPRRPSRPPAQEVTYTPALPLNRKKMLLRLITAAAVALALFLGFTIFFRVEKVTVTGTQRYTPWSVREASGIEEGASLLAFGKTKAASRVMENLRYIKSVRIGVTLPDTVNICVEELEVVYGAQDAQGGWWLIASDGRVVEKANETKARDNTLLKGFRLENPVAGEIAAGTAVQNQPVGENEHPVLVTDQDRLEAVLSVVTQLERCEILGEAANVDVTDPGNIQLWYGDDYQVLLGNPDRMDEKIRMMAEVINQHEQAGGYQSGVLDITLSAGSDKVGYTPFG